MNEEQDKIIYIVVVNPEEQYSIWPAGRAIPLGWRDAGKTGQKAECLEYITTVWTDMRPLSLHRQMEQASVKSGN
jgi:MbtH protein